MPVFLLGPRPQFPDPRLADDSGLLAVGGDFAPERLLAAYASGIFPWPMGGRNDLWFSPPRRMLLDPRGFAPARSLRARIRRGDLRVTADTAFGDVIDACSRVPRPGQGGTWIGAPVKQAYTALHRLGWAHSFEVWSGTELVGGLYGVSIGAMFCGESMFHRQTDASKVAFAALARFAAHHDFAFVDCQVHTDHLASLGAAEVDRDEFLARLAPAVRAASITGPWTERWAAIAAQATATDAG